MRCIYVILALLMSVSILSAQDNWQGTWEGELVNLPERVGVAKIKVVREVGTFPKKTGQCSIFRTTYYPAGKDSQSKNYKLCKTESSYAIDENNGIVLESNLIGDSLVSTFKFNNTLLMSVTTVEGDSMIENIYIAKDQPSKNGVVSLKTNSIQRLIFKRKTK